MPLDTSETQKLLNAIDDFQVAVRNEGEAILTKGAVEARRNLQADAQKSTYFRQIARTINFDKRRTALGVEIELGPDKDRDPAASLAGIAYFGGANGGGGTLDIDEPVERELDVIDEHLQRLGNLL
ncbi:hypothetical protein GCM10009700_31720 [Brevibacterium sanguinis]|uniref:hypothetical protein n=1 Tax=Brevibacterium sanguinis TaxID=232444 RepID=UPI0031E2A505